jgi:hypothetical protein
LVGGCLPLHVNVHVGSLCVRFSRAVGLSGLFGAGLRSGFGEVMRVGVGDGFSLGVRCLLMVSLRALGDVGGGEVYLAVETGGCGIPCCAHVYVQVSKRDEKEDLGRW